MGNRKVVSIEERIPKIKERRKQKANRRLITYLSIFFLLMMSVIYFQSSLSKISEINVIGNQNITNEQIISLSKLVVGTSFWNINNEKVEQRIKQHPEVKSVTIEKKFPNIVNIKIKELKRVAYILNNQNYLPILEDGSVLKSEQNNNLLANAPLFVNWSKGEDIQEMVAQLKKLPISVTNSISEIHYTPIPTDSLKITVYMNDGNQVIGSIRNFADRMKYYPAMVNELDANVKGIFYIDVETRFVPYGDDNIEGKR